ncbi:MAG: hypothetical protein JJW00_03825 [Sulfurimonas sp.]|nr:hypothetical protein [Sulfurimonas sp.]
MDLDISTWMMIFFALALVISISKIYTFLPSKKLLDDDTTQDSQEELIGLMLKVIKSSDASLSADKLYIKMCSDEDFNKKHFWRFNQNKLNQLLKHYYLKNRDISSIEDIHKRLLST